jgi:hypothetical protein
MPDYAKVLDITGTSASDVDFDTTYRSKIATMVTSGGNEGNAAAKDVIGALGFPFINALMVKQGLFDPTAREGLWLGGDYWNATTEGYYRRIPTGNDGLCGPAMNAYQTARLMRQWWIGRAAGARPETDALENLRNNMPRSWLRDDANLPPTQYSLVHAKRGAQSVSAGGDTMSELSIWQRNADNTTLFIVFLNLLAPSSADENVARKNRANTALGLAKMIKQFVDGVKPLPATAPASP